MYPPPYFTLELVKGRTDGLRAVASTHRLVHPAGERRRRHRTHRRAGEAAPSAPARLDVRGAS